MIWGYDDTMTWWDDAMMIWWYGDMVLWWYDPMMMWWYDAMMIWWYDAMMIRSYDDVMIWCFSVSCAVSAFFPCRGVSCRRCLPCRSWRAGPCRCSFRDVSPRVWCIFPCLPHPCRDGSIPANMICTNPRTWFSKFYSSIWSLQSYHRCLFKVH